MLPESKMTFSELTKWYLEQASVKKLASYDRVALALKNFNDVFGDFQVNEIKQVDLEEYQQRRKKQKMAEPKTFPLIIMSKRCSIVCPVRFCVTRSSLTGQSHLMAKAALKSNFQKPAKRPASLTVEKPQVGSCFMISAERSKPTCCLPVSTGPF